MNNRLNVNQRYTSWQHNPAYRGGVPYRDATTRQRFNHPMHGGVTPRQDFRGFDGNRDQMRQRAQNVLNNHGINPQQVRQHLPAIQNRMNNAPGNRNLPDRPGGGSIQPNWSQHDHALGGNTGSAPNWRQQINRGTNSRQMMQGRPMQFNRPNLGGGHPAIRLRR